MVRLRSGDREGAAQDADWLLKRAPQEIDLDQLRDFRAMLEKNE